MEKYPQFECEVKTIKPKDFDATWERWLEEVHAVPNHIEIVKVEAKDYGKRIEFYYDSVANAKIFAVYYKNEKHDGPVVAYYHGHNSHIKEDHNVWHAWNLLNQGLSVVAIDMRFQSNSVIDKNDYKYRNYPSACFNIDDLENCYNKRLDQDALKIIDIIRDKNCFPELANKKIFVAGPSQGGGLSMMVAAMSPYISASLSDVPSDCALKDRILGRYGKYGVIKDFLEDHPELEEKVLGYQDYFDVINMADRITCPIITSVGGKDEICPPRFFYQAYKKIPGEKSLYIYPDCGHGGFEEQHLPLKYEFIAKHK